MKTIVYLVFAAVFSMCLVNSGFMTTQAGEAPMPGEFSESSEFSGDQKLDINPILLKELLIEVDSKDEERKREKEERKREEAREREERKREKEERKREEAREREERKREEAEEQEAEEQEATDLTPILTPIPSPPPPPIPISPSISEPVTVILPNCFQVTFLGVTYNSDGTSTWRYFVEELSCAQDLSNWVLELPSCVTAINASPEPHELVDPDPNARLSGIKWQTGAGFQSGEFTVTLDAHWAVGVINVAAKGPDVVMGQIAGPICQTPVPTPIPPLTPTPIPTPTPMPTPISTPTPTPTLTPESATVILPNCFQITFLGATYNSDGTSTWRYSVEELSCAQDLSNWVLELLSCVTVINAFPDSYELVDPDLKTRLSGIKWETTEKFQQGEFTITLDAHWAVGVVNVTAKGPDVAGGYIAGPICQQ